jgi:hypothetical protein
LLLGEMCRAVGVRGRESIARSEQKGVAVKRRAMQEFRPASSATGKRSATLQWAIAHNQSSSEAL